jgi:hypothetical protein
MNTLSDWSPAVAWLVGAIVVAGIICGAAWTFWQAWSSRRSK